MSRSCKECVHHNPDFIDKACLHCSWPEFPGEPSNFKPKPITNYESLVSKTPEEMAEFLTLIMWGEEPNVPFICATVDKWLNWLRQETESDG